MKKRCNFQLKCRICGRVGRRFWDILDCLRKEEPRSLHELVLKYLDLEIREDDGLPKKICEGCSKKLTAWQAFHTQCMQIQEKLKRDVAKLSVEVPCPFTCLPNKQNVKSKKSIPPSNQRKARKSVRKLKTRRRPLVLDSSEKHSVNVKSLNDGSVVSMENEDQELPVLHDSPEEASAGATPKEVSQQTSSDPRSFHATDSTMVSDGNGDRATKASVTSSSSSSSTTTTTTTTAAAASTAATAAGNDVVTTSLSPIEPVTCETCGRRFRNDDALAFHVASQHAEHRCSVCAKLFKNKFSLRSHMFVHAERRHFCCHVCGRLFRTASCLCNHVRAQHGGGRGGDGGARPFECPHCSKLFGQRFHLVQHMRSHTGERPFACPECPQRFASRCQLTRHERGRHRRDARFACDHCGRRFRYSSNYKVHLQAHQGPTLQCADCDRSFTSNNGLLRHRRLHTGEKPFPCSVCGKRFADCSNRKRHMALHAAGPRPPRAPRARKSSVRALSAPDSTTTLPPLGHSVDVTNSLPPASSLSSTVLLAPASALSTNILPATSNIFPASTTTSAFSVSAAYNSIPGGVVMSNNPSQPVMSSLVPSVTLTTESVPPTEDARSFTSLRAFLESSEVAALADSSQPTTAPLPASSLAVTAPAQPATEMLTLLTTGDGGLQQMLLLPAGLLDVFESEPTPTPPMPPTPVPPVALLDKEAIVRMLNSQGTTIA